MPSTPEQLINQASRHQVYLEGQKTHSVNQVLELMADLEDKIVTKLSRKDITEFTRARLEKQITSIRGFMDDYYGGPIEELWRKQLNELSTYEAGFEVRSLQNVTQNFEYVLPSDTQVIAAVYSAPLSVTGPDKGKLLESFYKDWTQNQIDKVDGAIRAGFFQGETTPQIVRNLMDDTFKVNRRTMTGLVRTGLQHASTMARKETWNRNQDIVKKRKMVATLDGKTSTLCRSIDGQVFPLDKGPRSPLHLFCRTVEIAVLDDRFSLFEKDAERKARDEDGVTSVNADLTYYGWLKKQPAKFQDSVIGPTRGKLLRDGGLTAQRFAELNLGKNFEPLDLKTMAKLEPLAFEKAGIQ